MKKSQLWSGVLILLLAAVALFGIQIYRPAPDAGPEVAETLTVAADCDAAETACAAGGEGLAVELALGPDVQPMEAFPIRLRTIEGRLPASAVVELEFRMQAMDMGMNRYRLLRNDQGAWTGEVTLPACSSGRSDWLADVEIRQGGQRWTARFPFTAQ